MSEDAKIFNYKEYLKQYPFNTRAKEFWKLFRVRGSLENRHISFYMCQHCSNKLYNNQEKLKFEVDSEEKFAGCHINFIICEDCIEHKIQVYIIKKIFFDNYDELNPKQYQEIYS